MMHWNIIQSAHNEIKILHQAFIATKCKSILEYNHKLNSMIMSDYFNPIDATHFPPYK